MNHQTFTAKLLQSVCLMLNIPPLGVGWLIHNRQVQILFAMGEPFTTPEGQSMIQQYLPALLRENPAPHLVNLDRGQLDGLGTLLLLSAPFNDDTPAVPRAGLLIGLPTGMVILEDQWQGLQAVGELIEAAFEGPQTPEESYRRQVRLRAAATVSRDATILLSPEELLQRAARLISEQFGFYHVGLFLVDEAREYAVLRAANSEGGRRLMAQNHRLKIGAQGMVGYVSQTGEPRIALDVDTDTVHFVNPELPYTRSEMTLPLRHGGEIIGALDVQSTESNAFTEDDFTTLQLMADQLANALINARLYRDLEQQLADNAELVTRLSEQTRELHRAYEEARHLSEVRTQMVQNVSHELRTPLSIILGYTEMLGEGLLGELTPQQAEVIHTVINRAHALQRMIQSLTTLQKYTRPEAFSPLALPDLLVALLREFQELAAKQKVRFTLECSPTLPPILGDREQLYLALSHVIENAVKFSPTGGIVTIRAHPKSNWVIIEVQDQGIGIEDHHLRHIFEPFYQADGSPTRRFGCMGIGLALVWDIIEAHNGHVSVKSEPGKGSTFTILLPLPPTIPNPLTAEETA